MQKSSLLRLLGLLCILVVVGLTCYVVLFYYGEYLGVSTQATRVIAVITVLLALCYIFKIWQMNALKSTLMSYTSLVKYKSIFFCHGSQLLNQMLEIIRRLHWIIIYSLTSALHLKIITAIAGAPKPVFCW